MIFGTALRALKWLKVLKRVEDAWEESAMALPVSETKLGTVVAAIAGLCGLFLAVESGSMNLIDAIVAAVGIIGTVIAIFGGRNAAGKIVAAIKDGK